MRIARDGTLLYINDAGLSLLPQWHLQVGQASPPMLREAVFQSLDNVSTQVPDLEHGERLYSFFVAPIVAAGYVNLYGRDITERKQAEQALQNSYHKLRESLIATVNTLASTVEMKDPYTAGHQRRVTILACAIAEEMGLIRVARTDP